MNAGKVVLLVGLAVFSFFAHLLFQKLHYDFCTSNLFYVLFFKTSNFCRILEDGIALIEFNYKKFLI